MADPSIDLTRLGRGDENCCAGCVFFASKQIQTGTGSPKGAVNHLSGVKVRRTGECRRNSPLPDYVPPAGALHQVGWPQVDEGAWCGEQIPRRKIESEGSPST